ncbi:MAG: hypothetical protein FIB01_12130 [Gemmatimonadetes bacterium]|nr:hypothetical protein [Gemmatimonadota bacterium]
MAETLNFDAVILDEAATPPLRLVIGSLLSRARRADVAAEHVRLAGLDLTAPELRQVHCRLLMGALDVEALSDLAIADQAAPRLGAIGAFMRSGRLDVRVGGLLRWRPDFAVFELPPPHGAVALVGALYFTDAAVAGGPALTCVIRSPAAVARLRRRFDDLWLRARDVGDVIHGELAALGMLRTEP